MAARRKGVVGGFTGTEDTIRNLRIFGRGIDRELQKLAVDTAIRVESTAKKKIQRGKKSGRLYRRGKKWHRASAPGEAPATDTGTLASSIARVDGDLMAGVGTNLQYGRDLEFGTKKMKARPWLFPSLEEHRKYYIEGLKRIGKNAMKGIRVQASKIRSLIK